MGWVFCCANTASQRPDIPNHFIWILDFNVQWLFELLWDDFNVTIDVCLLDFELVWFYFFPAVVYFFFLSLSSFLVGIVFSRWKKAPLLLNWRSSCSDIFSSGILSQFVCSRTSNMNEIIDIRVFFCILTLCVCRFFPFCWRRLCILFDFPLIFYSCLHWCHSHFGGRFIQHLLLVSIIIWSETRPFLSNCVFVEKEREWGKKIRLFKRPIYIYIENVRNNPQQSIVKTVWKWKCAKCHRSWLWGVPFIRNFVLQTTSLLSLLLPSSSRMVVLVVFF